MSEHHYKELLRELAQYAAATQMERYRIVRDEEGEILGYWQTPEYLEGLIELAAKAQAALGETFPSEETTQPPETLNYRAIEKMHGDGGYWCQGDAVFIQASHPTDAVERYRRKLTSGQIGISSHLPCVASVTLQKIREDWRYRLLQRLYPDVPGLQRIEKARAIVAEIEDIELLRFALLVAIESHSTVREWLNHASTQNAAHDAMWRFQRILWGLGINTVGAALDWRGSLIEALERAGFRASEDGDIRQILPGQPGWKFAKGITLQEFVDRALSGTTSSPEASVDQIRAIAQSVLEPVEKSLIDLVNQVDEGVDG